MSSLTSIPVYNYNNHNQQQMMTDEDGLGLDYYHHHNNGQQATEEEEEYNYPQQQYFPPTSSSSYQIRHSNENSNNSHSESFFTFINKYEKDEAREEEEISNNVSDSKIEQSNTSSERKGNDDDDISILLRIYSRRFTPETIHCIISFLPISLSSLISKSYQSVFDVTHYKSLYQFGYNNFYSKHSQHIYKRVNATWKDTLLEMVKMQFREKDQILNSKFPHPSVKLSQNFMGFVAAENLMKNLKSLKILENFQENSSTIHENKSRKLKFTMITYEKYNTSEMFKLFNRNNQYKIGLDGSTVEIEYEMNYVGYLLPGSHDFENFANADAIILTYSVIDFNLFYTLSSWINLLETIAPDVPVILLGTHSNYRKDAHIMTKLKKKERYVMRFMDCVELARKFNLLSYLEMDACNYVGYEKEISSSTSSGCGSCSEGEEGSRHDELAQHHNENVDNQSLLTNNETTTTTISAGAGADGDGGDDDDVPIETIIDISSDHIMTPFIELPDSISKQIHQTLELSSMVAIHFRNVNNEISIRNLWKGTTSLYSECLPSKKCSIQ